MSFAAKLQEIRIENNISQEGLAEMLGVSRQSVSKWERGKGYPEIEKLIFISEKFGVSLDELLKEKKDASGKPRRTINLKKETGKSDSMRISYPENSAGEEIYPERKPYAEAEGEKKDFFNHEVVEDGAGLAQYTNYSYSQPENSSTGTGSRRSRFAQRRARFRKHRPAVLITCFLISLAGFITGLFSQYRASVRHGMQSPVEVYSDYYVSEEDYQLRYMVEETSGMRYVFEYGSWGLVTDLNFTDLSECIKLKEVSTGEYYYCHQNYSDDCVTIIDDNNICYLIPRFLVLTNVDVENQKNYTAYQDVNSKEWFFVPDWVIRTAGEVLDGDTASVNDNNAEENAGNIEEDSLTEDVINNAFAG